MRDSFSQKITITLPADLLKKVDKLAEHDYAGRSDIIRAALLRLIREPQNKLIVDPESVATAKMYDYVKDDHPYLDPDDGDFVLFLYDQKINKQRLSGETDGL